MIWFFADNHYGTHAGRNIYEKLPDDLKRKTFFQENDWSLLENGCWEKECELLVLHLIGTTCGLPHPGAGAEKAVRRYVERGGDILLLHGSSAAFWAWDWWRKIVGLRWVRSNDPDGVPASTHPTFACKVIPVEKPDHPLEGKLRPFELGADEVYIHLQPVSPVRILMTVASEGETFPQACETVTPYGGRIFSFIPGHKPESVAAPGLLENVVTILKYLTEGKTGKGKPKAAFLCSRPETVDRVYGKGRRKRVEELADVLPETVTPENFHSLDLRAVEYLFSTWGMPCLSDEQLDRMPNLKAVFYAAGATDRFSRPLLRRGIHVVSAWKANALPVAEFTVAQIILGLKGYFKIARRMRGAGRVSQADSGCGAYGRTVALLGAGAISSHAAELLKSYDLKVITVASRADRRTVSLEEAFAASQVVSNHFPDRDDNIGILNGKLFESMPENAVFINTGRGRQVNEAEMIAVLEKRPDLTVMLDVTFPEPSVEGSKLYTLENVFLSPHIAGSLNDELFRMSDYVIADFKRALLGEPFRYEIHESMLLTSK